MSIWCGKRTPFYRRGTPISTPIPTSYGRSHSARFLLMFNVSSTLLFELYGISRGDAG
ncbi:hypothetical protein ACVIHD_007362 [Bradyrhizobium embrapense]